MALTVPDRDRLHVILVEPEIAGNTGAIGRTCVALGAKLWLVRPLGFQMTDRHIKRAGLDYWPHLDWTVVDHLDEVVAAAQHALDNTRSVGVGLSPCTIPAAGKPNFTIPDGQMEVGIGHHGEPGIAVMPTAPAADMAALMVERVVADLPFAAGDEVLVLVSGLGATPLMELYLFYGHVDALLRARGIVPRRRLVGNYFTSLEMMGVSLTLMRLDPELERLMAAPARSIGLTLAEGW